MRWKSTAPDAEWTKRKSDGELVQEFVDAVFSPYWTHVNVGRRTRDMRHRLQRILIDGLAAKSPATTTTDEGTSNGNAART
jgi:hypothetical protein